MASSLTQPLFGPGGRQSDTEQQEDGGGQDTGGQMMNIPQGAATGSSPVKQRKKSDPLVAVRAGDISDQITDLKENFGSAISNFHQKQKVLERNMDVLKKQLEVARAEKDQEVEFSARLSTIVQNQQEKLKEEQEKREILEVRTREMEHELLDAQAALFQSELKSYELSGGEKEDVFYPEVLLSENKRLQAKIREVAEDTRPLEEIERLQTELQTKEPLLTRIKDDLRKAKLENQRLESENGELKSEIELNQLDLKEIPLLREELARIKIELVARKEESDQIQIENNTLRDKMLEIGEELLMGPMGSMGSSTIGMNDGFGSYDSISENGPDRPSQALNQ